ncbi:MAG: mercury resistance protein [Gammaproteobacteria bacterium]|nr:mercury resistance protein [Gammaproteobacteria bacterium]
MSTTEQTKNPFGRRLRTGLFTLLAIISCPCHIPILLVVLSGTSLGLLLAAHTALAVTVLSAIFIASLAVLFRILHKRS